MTRCTYVWAQKRISRRSCENNAVIAVLPGIRLSAAQTLSSATSGSSWRVAKRRCYPKQSVQTADRKRHIQAFGRQNSTDPPAEVVLRTFAVPHSHLLPSNTPSWGRRESREGCMMLIDLVTSDNAAVIKNYLQDNRVDISDGCILLL